MRRGVSRPLLRSAVVALGAGGGFVVGGCLLCGGAPAASAQTLAVVAPLSGPPAGPPGAHGAHAGTHSKSEHHGHSTLNRFAHARKGTGSAGAAQHQQKNQLQTQHQATGGPSHRSLHMAIPSLTGSQTTTSSGGTTTLHKPRLVRGPSPSAGQTSSGQKPQTGKGKGDGRSGSGSTPAPGTSDATPVFQTVAAIVPSQRPARPERFFTIPLAPLLPVPTVGGPLPSAALPLAPVRRAGSQLFHFEASMLPRGWAGESLHEADKLKLPIALLVAIAVFMLVQALVDRRDPKVADAPERPTDDSVQFE